MTWEQIASRVAANFRMSYRDAFEIVSYVMRSQYRGRSGRSRLEPRDDEDYGGTWYESKERRG